MVLSIRSVPSAQMARACLANNFPRSQGALAAVAPVAFVPRSVVVIALRIDIMALAPGTLEGPLFPSQRVDVGMTLIGVEELVEVREHWHG